MISKKFPDATPEQHQQYFSNFLKKNLATYKHKVLNITASLLFNLKVKNILPHMAQPYSQISTQMMVSLWKNTLESLRFPSNTNFSGIVFDKTPYQALKQVALSYTSSLSKDQLLTFIQCLPKTLESFHSASEIVDNEVVHALAQQCPNIIDLRLFECHQLTTLPALKNLKKLELSHAPISNEAFAKLAENSPEIEELRLEVCSEISKFPKGWSNLIKLTIQYGGLPPELIHDIAQANGDTIKDFSLNNIGGNALDEFPSKFKFICLENVDLPHVKQGNQMLHYIVKGSPKIKNLSIYADNLNQYPKNLTSLEHIRLNHSTFSNNFLEGLIHTTGNALKTIDMSDTSGYTQFSKGLHNLEKINLNGAFITDECLESLAESISKNCQSIALANCRNITKLPEKILGFLEKINLSYTAVPNKDFQALAKKNGAKLRELNVAGCKNILPFPPEFTNLEELNLSETDIDDESLETIVNTNLRTLKSLILYDCSKITKLSPSMKNLENIEWDSDSNDLDDNPND